mgnify:CR=1 FL=1
MNLIYILLSIKTRIETNNSGYFIAVHCDIYILLSIKTRIETMLSIRWMTALLAFISYYPLKQGLKLLAIPVCEMMYIIYILLSIKTRIETLISHVGILISI